MKKDNYTWFLWIPKILGLFFALVLCIFSFDSFEGNFSIWVKLGGFFIHNIPSILMLMMIILLWRRPFWTGVIFICLGILFTGFFRTITDLASFMLISFPVFLVGFLFVIASFMKKETHKTLSDADNTPPTV